VKDPLFVRFACAVYRAMLIFYPRAHRREYGREMYQLFRDQCRVAARRGGRFGVLCHCPRTLTDLIFSATREHVANQVEQMKNIAPSRASLILIITAILLQQLSVSLAFHGRPLVTLCVWISTLALVLRAVMETMRPTSEWRRGLLWALGIAVVYALICPAWAHTADRIGLPLMTMAAVKAHLFAFAINLIVPLVKTVVALVSRPRA
jgi:hypothetical protein